MAIYRLTMDKTAIYRIRFQGAFDESWQQHLGAGFTVQFDDASVPGTTTITGVMRDQAALLGLLSSLYEVGLPLLAVECLETGGEQSNLPVVL